MGKRWLLGGGALLLSGCANDGTPASAYRNPLDQITAALGMDFWTCYREDDGVYAFVGYDQCYRFKEPQRMRGVWIDEFEGSRFVPGKQDLSGIKWRDPKIWLQIESKQIAGLFGRTGQRDTGLRAFRIDFVGRQTAVPGRYGHVGESEHLIIMDRLLSAEPIDAEPWQKEIDAFLAEVDHKP